MELPINYNRPLIMHVDLNSCFAIIEQQANPLIRYKPVGVAAYDSPGGMIIASSYEAKRLGIKMMSVRDARLICKDIIILMPDPAKYRNAHQRFKEVLLNYTSEVVPKSIDEFVIDFRGSRAIAQGRSLEDVGLEMKARIKESLGEYVTVNIGIGTNRFLAKTAAGLHKPDGLDVITGKTILPTYETMHLTDITGINTRYEARLNIAGIYTPLQFFHATGDYLAKRVFKSKLGYDWYARLRGWEVDDHVWATKSYGHQFALREKTFDRQELSRLLMKLSEKVGRRMRANDYCATGIHVWCSFTNHQYWHKGKDTKNQLYSTQDIYLYAQQLFNRAEIPAKVSHIGVTVYNLCPSTPEQLGLFDSTRMDKRSMSRAADTINDRYGEFTLVPATMANMRDVILDRIAFGSVKDL
ncbi:MAG: DNA polymerase IV [Candidatus Saccharimonadales bacterium]